jgi:hypothetical protein
MVAMQFSNKPDKCRAKQAGLEEAPKALCSGSLFSHKTTPLRAKWYQCQMASHAHHFGHVLRSLANKRIVDEKVESAKGERMDKSEVQWCR